MTKTPTEQQIRKIIENGTGKAAKVCKQKFYDKPKSLTEQWREGKLPEDTYYVRFICGRYGVYEFEQYKGFGFDNDLAYIKEVLSPVPSYDEYKRLQDENKKLKEQIESANKTINSMVGNGYCKADDIGQEYIEKWKVEF